MFIEGRTLDGQTLTWMVCGPCGLAIDERAQQLMRAA